MWLRAFTSAKSLEKPPKRNCRNNNKTDLPYIFSNQLQNRLYGKQGHSSGFATEAAC